MADRAAGDGDDPRRAARSGHHEGPARGGLRSKPRGGLWSGGGQRRPGKDGALPYLMIAPLVVFIAALAIYPTVLTIIEAFFHSDVLTPPDHFVGFGNFTELFSSAQVRTSIENTGWYALFGVAFTVAIGTGIGLLLQRPFRGRGIILAIVILPWALPGRGRGRDLVVDLQPHCRRAELRAEERAPDRPISAVYRPTRSRRSF